MLQHPKQKGEEVRENCQLKSEDMNWTEVAKYGATCLKPWETKHMKVDKLIPVRATNRGWRPTLTGKTITVPTNTKQKVEQIWFPQRSSFTATEQRYVLAAALEIGLKVEVYKQKSGGPIGKCVTCPAAKIRINRWFRKVKLILMKLELDMPLIFVYIDNFRIGMTPIPFGYTWDHNKQQWEYSVELEDLESLSMTQEEKTKITLLHNNNGINRDLSFTVEC